MMYKQHDETRIQYIKQMKVFRQYSERHFYISQENKLHRCEIDVLKKYVPVDTNFRAPSLKVYGPTTNDAKYRQSIVDFRQSDEDTMLVLLNDASVVLTKITREVGNGVLTKVD